MSVNRKRSKTRAMSSYANEGTPRRYVRNKGQLSSLLPTITKKPSDSFGLPSELARSPVHGFYRNYNTQLYRR